MSGLKSRYFLILLMCLGLSNSVFADSSGRSVRFKHVSRNDGLSQSYVYAIEQDQQGFMWFGTQEGLNRFDGYEFKIYTHDINDSSSISDNSIRALLVDRDGTLWVGTDGGGLSSYDPVTDKFTNHRYDPGNESSIASNRVRVLHEDARGNIWVGTDGAGLNFFDKESGTFERHPQGLKDLTDPHIWAIFEDASGLVWIGTEGGLNLVDMATMQLIRFQHDRLDSTTLSDNHVRAIYQDEEGNLWIGTQDGGLNRYDRNSRSFDRFQFDAKDPLSISNNTITSIFQDNKGVLWVGTFNGLNAWRPDTEVFERYAHDGQNRYSIAHDTVMSIYQDTGSVLWIGTYDGLSSWNPATSAMLHYIKSDAASSLSNNTVTSFAEDGSGDIWIGTFGGGLNRFNQASGRFTHILHEPGNPDSLSDDRVMALEVDRFGDLWVGTRANGLNRLAQSDSSLRFQHFKHDENDPGTLSADGITSILEDSYGELWIGIYGGGINKFNRDTNTFDRYQHDSRQPDSLSSNRVLVMFEDSERIIWVGTQGGGLNRFDRQSGTFSRFRHDANNKQSLPSDNILMITEDRFGNLWVGTQGRGLARWNVFDKRNGNNRFQSYTESDGLPSSTIYAAEWDANGDLWFSTNNGLTKLNIQNDQIVNFGVGDGLQHVEFNLAASLETSSGQLFFGGVNGFNAFSPASIEVNIHPPPSVITEVLKLNKPLDLATEIDDGRIYLTHSDYVIAFRFAGLDFTAPNKNKYRYMLEGLDSDWIDAGHKRQATYTNLAPRDYVFRVQSANNSGVWSSQDATLQLTVLPAPWLTWWAYIGYFLIIAALAYVLMKSQYQKIRQAEEVMLMNHVLKHEIEARQEKEKELRREKDRTERYFEVAEVILLNLDKSGTVTLINKKGLSTLKLEEAEIVGRCWTDFVPDSIKDEVEVHIREAFEDIYTSYNYYFEYPILSSDGTENRILWRSALLKDPGSDLPYVFASGIDVTELRNLERAVRVKEKLAAVGTMAGGIAHDFNNILTAIYGYSVLSLDEISGNDTVSEYLSRIVSASERARSLVERMLTFAQSEETELNPCDIAPTIKEACALLRGSLPSTIDVTVEVQTDLPTVLADPTQIHQLVMNLGTNAGKAMSSVAGVLSVKVESVFLRRRDLHFDSTLRPGQHIVIAVADTGVGMDAKTVDQIFNPFFSSSELGFGKGVKGTGLGLSVVHSIVSGHNGHIEVTSTKNVGSTFRVYLPSSELAEVETIPDQLMVDDSSGHILLVDDEKFVGDAGKKMLEKLGYSVTLFDDPLQALEFLGQESDSVDLLITDETMPGLTGSQLAEIVRKYNMILPIVIVSGNLKPVKETENITFLSKPYTMSELQSTVSQAISREVAVN